MSRSRRILIVSTRYLGDCLLSAALAGPLREAYPDAEVDLLTYRSNLPVLEGVPGIRKVIGVKERPSKLEQLREMIGLWNAYDWAVLTQASTRTFVYGWFAGRRQAVARPGTDHRGWWKRLLVSDPVPPQGGHWLDSAASVLEPVIGQVPQVLPVAPDASLPPEWRLDFLYVVLQTNSRYRDKAWRDDGWCVIVGRLLERGFGVVFTGGPSADEIARIRSIADAFPSERVRIAAGKLSFGQTARLVRSARAFVGVDTATTHVAAATGTPVVALFGPTNVTVWGPAPAVPRVGAYSSQKAIQTSGNVTILRHPDYIGCSGCLRHRCPKHDPDELAACLQGLSAEAVWNALEPHLH